MLVLLYESHRRKPGWRFTAGLKHKPRPKGTATFYDVDLFELVSRQQNPVEMKMCHMQSILYVLNFDLGWVWASGDNAIETSIWLQFLRQGTIFSARQPASQPAASQSASQPPASNRLAAGPAASSQLS